MNEDAGNEMRDANEHVNNDVGPAPVGGAPRDVEWAVRRASDAALRQLQDDGFTAALLQQRLPNEARRRAWQRRLVLGSAAGSGFVAAAAALTFEWPRLGIAFAHATAVKGAPTMASLNSAVHAFSAEAVLHWATRLPTADVAVVAVGMAMLLTTVGWMTRAFEP